jgi:hypothetical protein
VAEGFHVVPVPHHLEREVGVAIEVLRRELHERHPDVHDSAITLSERSSRGMFGGFGEETLIYVARSVTTVLTERFVTEIVWPKLKPLVDNLTDGLVNKADELLQFLISLTKR